jgi:DNA repair protein RadC
MLNKASDHFLLEAMVGRRRAKVAGASLGELLEKSDANLADLGFSAATRLRLLACAEIARRYQPRTTDPLPITSAQRALAHLCDLRDQDREVVSVLLLDSRLAPTGLEQVAAGGVARVGVTPREVFAPAIVSGSTAVILAHNHPSGCADPSREDHAFTRSMVEAGRQLQIQVIDHLIVTRRGYFSFHEAGQL